MSAIKAIYQAPKTFMQENATTVATVYYNGQKYTGMATLHPEDMDFNSEKIGRTIALSRARQAAIKAALKTSKQIATIKSQMYREVLGYGSVPSTKVDPTGALYRNMRHAYVRVYALEEALQKEEKGLKNYLAGQKIAIASIRRMRANKDKNN